MSLLPRIAGLAVAVALAAACNQPVRAPAASGPERPASRSVPVASESVQRVSTAAPSEGAATASAASSAGEPLLRAEHDLDGEAGAELVALYPDGVLRAGAAAGRAELTEAGPFWMKERAALRFVALRAGQPAVLLVLPTADEEDPASRFQLFQLAGTRLERVLDITPGFANAERLSFPGDGTARYVETSDEACRRAGPQASSAPLQEVIYEWATAKMVERSRKSGRKVRCAADALMACPYVYVGSDGRRAGEVLRNVRSRADARLQGLALGASSQSTLRVVIREQKPEISHLDEVFVLLDGQRLDPRSCQGAQPPAYCARDGDSLQLAPGQELALEFTLPAIGVRPFLLARGYYEPLGGERPSVRAPRD